MLQAHRATRLRNGAPAPTVHPSLAPTPLLRSRPARQVSVKNNWRTFGPSTEYSDGDAEYFQLTSRLSQQYEWFAPGRQQQEAEAQPEEQASSSPQTEQGLREATFGLSEREIRALGLAGPRTDMPNPKSLSSKAYYADRKLEYGNNVMNMAGGNARAGRRYSGARAAYGEYPNYPEGRPIFLPEAERFGNPPDLPSLLLQQRVIYISMPFLPSVTELVVAQCYYLDFDDRNRQRPIYVYLNSTGCINEKGQAISADNEFYAIWAALGFTRAPLYTGVTWKAQNQAAVLLSAGQKGHRYSFPHAKISTAPPVMNRVFGQTVDAQLQANELDYATKYYAAILSRSTGKDLETCQKLYLSRKRYFSVKQAYEEGLVDKLVPGFMLNRFRKMQKDMGGDEEAYEEGLVDKLVPGFMLNRFRKMQKDMGGDEEVFDTNKPKFKFTRQA
ncbi:hypothetical protein GPECTOR_28g789 [Gonium pectorale]|uniref:ATP-dependent Clp protease proteolytic subunit n=1 Tax=Gonium pectorale TaxID=33097 RepID=A0A150GEW8_GONPE|nr:hypothetical protein GPECTOR_28g789 [Gonium pectorale]|eukprot:KXZ48382.1 hypothetical protein GPECTOR_28g789 [Gonium pectorale]